MFEKSAMPHKFDQKSRTSDAIRAMTSDISLVTTLKSNKNSESRQTHPECQTHNTQVVQTLPSQVRKNNKHNLRHFHYQLFYFTTCRCQGHAAASALLTQ